MRFGEKIGQNATLGSRLFVAAGDNAGVVSAKAERVVQRDINAPVPGRVRTIVEITTLASFIEINPS